MLNILRFIAFMAIFLLHSKIFIPVNWNENFKYAWLLYTPAWAGTWIFFILSGYGIGCGFYSGKYELSLKGIIRFYVKRIVSVLPIYYLFVVAISIFIVPEILVPSREHIVYLLKLLLFDYQAEFYGTEFGLAWYMTTLMRLYLVAPIGCLLINRLVKSKKAIYVSLLIIIAIGLAARCFMKYYISLTNSGDWSSSVYTPFYFNIDLFFAGMLISCLRKYVRGGGVTGRFPRFASLFAMFMLIIVNSYLYYVSTYCGSNYLYLYMYIFPSIYIIVTCLYIYIFEVNRNFKSTALSIQELKKNPMRIFDYFQKIQFSVYLFHSIVLYQLAKVYNYEFYEKICILLKIPLEKYNFAIGCLFTLIAFSVSVIWAIVLYVYSKPKERK